MKKRIFATFLIFLFLKTSYATNATLEKNEYFKSLPEYERQKIQLLQKANLSVVSII